MTTHYEAIRRRSRADVFDHERGEVFCTIPRELCGDGLDQAFARAKDIAGLFNKAAASPLEAMEVTEGWQPIETAPQGCMCLFADMTATEARNWAFVDWVVGGQFCGDKRRAATHWRPLPEPPNPSTQSGDTP